MKIGFLVISCLLIPPVSSATEDWAARREVYLDAKSLADLGLPQQHLESHLISATMARTISSPVNLVIGELCASTFREAVPFSAIGTARSHSSFLKADNGTDEWNDVATGLVAGWRHRNRFNGLPKEEGKALDPSNLTVIPMIAISCRLGDADAVAWHCEEFTNTCGTFPGMFGSLVRSGHMERAKKLLQNKCRDVRYSTAHYLLDPRYDRKLHESVEPFLETATDSDLRNYARILLMATPDPDPKFGTDPTVPPRSKRIAQAAEAISNEPIRDLTLASQADEILSTAFNESAVREFLDRPSADFFAKYDEMVGKRSGSTDVYWLAHTHFHDAIYQLSEGAPFPAQFFWGRLVYEQRENNTNLERNGTEAVVDVLNQWCEVALAEGRKEDLLRLLPFGRQVLEGVPELVYRRDVSDALTKPD